MNTVADESLEKGGVVLKQFLEAGAPKLKQVCSKTRLPEMRCLLYFRFSIIAKNKPDVGIISLCKTSRFSYSGSTLMFQLASTLNL